MGRKQKAKAFLQALSDQHTAPHRARAFQPGRLDAEDVQISAECTAALTEFCSGSRLKAKKALRKLAKDRAASHLPHRYLARVLFHEAAILEAPLDEASAARRLGLLQEAADAAKQATILKPGSLSSVALRAILALNLLVESSGFFGDGDTARAGKMPGIKQAQAIREQTAGAQLACQHALDVTQPLVEEPVITISTDGEQSCDSCILGIKAQVAELEVAKASIEIMEEKRRVLTSMNELLTHCQPLLQRQDFPINGIVALLTMDLVRPYQQQSPAWPDQLLCKGVGLVALQKQLSDPATPTAQLVKMMRQSGEIGHIPPPANALMPPPNLSIERNWDFVKDAATAAARRKARAKGDRRAEMTMQERYNDVKEFWSRLPPQERRKLLRVPVHSLLESMKKEQGPHGAQEMHQGLLLLQSQKSRRACYWSCPFCPGCRVGSVKEYMDHIETSHEEVQSSKEGPIMCCICSAEVVGTHFQSIPDPNLYMCMRCHYLETSTGKLTPGVHPFKTMLPHTHHHLAGWEENSDIMSTQGSCDDSFDDDCDVDAASIVPQVNFPVVDVDVPSPESMDPGLGPSTPSQSDAAAGDEEEGGSSQIRSPAAPGNSPVEAHASSSASISAWRTLPRQLQQWQLAATSKLSALVGSQAGQATKMTDAATENVRPSSASRASTSEAIKQAAAEVKQLQEQVAAMEAAQQQAEQMRAALSSNGVYLEVPASSQPAIGELPLDANGMASTLQLSTDSTALALNQQTLAAMDQQLTALTNGNASAFAPYYESASTPERQVVASIMQHINLLWSYDRDRFSSMLNNIISRAAELLRQHLATQAPDKEGLQLLFPESFRRNLQHPDTLEAALSRLSLEDLKSLMQYIVTSTPAGYALATYPIPAHVLRSDEDSMCDALGNIDEMTGCPPLFELRNAANDADLEQVVSAVVSPSEDGHRAADSNSKSLVTGSGDPILVVQPWWLDHLHSKEREQDKATAAGELKVLQWIYGNIVNTSAEEFLERRRDLLAERQPDMVMLDLVEDIAQCWRLLREATERKQHLEFLRMTAKKAMHDVREMDAHGLGGPEVQKAAQDYYDAFMPVYKNLSPANPAPFCHTAAAQMVNHQILSSNNTLRYASALVDRERCILELERTIFDHEVREVQLDASQALERHERACNDTADIEAELVRVQAEGPANHRKKDHIDKATKEAEHREKLSDLRARIDACKERCTLENKAYNTAQSQEDAAQRELDSIHQQQQEAEAHASNLAVVQQMNPEEQTWQDLLGNDPARWQTSIQEAWSRLLYVAHALNSYGSKDYYKVSTHEGEVLLHTQKSARQLLEALESSSNKEWDALKATRIKLQELSCVDLSLDVTDKALEIVRSQVETAATQAKVEASNLLLRELEEEKAAKKAKEEKTGRKVKPRQKLDKKRAAQEEEDSALEPVANGSAEEQTARKFIEAEEAARQAEVEYEAALARRRKEVEAERRRRENEQLRMLESMMGPAKDRSATGHREQTNPSTPMGRAAAGEGWSSEEEEDYASQASGDDEELYPDLRAAIAASMHDADDKEAGTAGDWQSISKEGSMVGEPRKRKSRRQRYKENKDKPDKEEKAEMEVPRQQLRIVSYYGDWVCECGRQNRLWDHCVCGQVGPCRDWVRGRCKYKDQCRFSHPPFQLPNGAVPASPIARPSAEALVLDGSGALQKQLPVRQGPSPPPPEAPSTPATRNLANSPAAQPASRLPSAPLSAQSSLDAAVPPARATNSVAADPPAAMPPNLANRTPKKPAKLAKAPPAGAAGSGSAPQLASHLRSRSLSRLSDLAEAAAEAGAQQPATQDDAHLPVHVAPTDSYQKGDDVVVAAPRRAASAKQLQPHGSAELPPSGWAQMGAWGKPFDPFAENPLQRALAADHRGDSEDLHTTAEPSRVNSFSRTTSLDGINDTFAGTLASLLGSTGHDDEANTSSESLRGISSKWSQAGNSSSGNNNNMAGLLPAVVQAAIGSTSQASASSASHSFTEWLPHSYATTSGALPATAQLQAFTPFGLPALPSLSRASPIGKGGPPTFLRGPVQLAQSAGKLEATASFLPNNSGIGLGNRSSDFTGVALQTGSQEHSAVSQRTNWSSAGGKGGTASLLPVLVEALAALPRARQAILMIQGMARRPCSQLVLALQSVLLALSKASTVNQMMGRAADTVPGELWAALLQAMDAAGGQGVQQGQLLTFLLEQLDLAASNGQRGSAIRQLFAMQAEEVMHCLACLRLVKRPSQSLTKLFPAAALGTVGTLPKGQRSTFEHVLLSWNQLTQRSCPRELGGCGMPNNFILNVTSLPPLFALALQWDSDSVSMMDIGAVTYMLPTLLDLGTVYQSGKSRMYSLQSMICRSSNYSWRISADTGGWRVVGGSQPPKVLGDWPAVLAQCRGSRMLPLFLFYEAMS